jgi:hypothetical protein
MIFNKAFRRITRRNHELQIDLDHACIPNGYFRRSSRHHRWDIIISRHPLSVGFFCGMVAHYWLGRQSGDHYPAHLALPPRKLELLEAVPFPT